MNWPVKNYPSTIDRPAPKEGLPPTNLLARIPSGEIKLLANKKEEIWASRPPPLVAETTVEPSRGDTQTDDNRFEGPPGALLGLIIATILLLVVGFGALLYSQWLITLYPEMKITMEKLRR